MRIVGGEFRGRTLNGPKSNAIRPTTDRTRESLFNILGHAYPDALIGKRVLDCFAGTGAIGLEAISRGATYTLFIENSVEGRALLHANIEMLGLQGKTRIFRRDATDLGPAGNMVPFDLLFADPPYGKGLGEKALAAADTGGWLKDDALVVLEEETSVDPLVSQSFRKLDERTFGDTRMHFYAYQPGQKR